VHERHKAFRGCVPRANEYPLPPLRYRPCVVDITVVSADHWFGVASRHRMATTLFSIGDQARPWANRVELAG
jgi:hypothetical protein